MTFLRGLYIYIKLKLGYLICSLQMSVSLCALRESSQVKVHTALVVTKTVVAMLLH